MAAGCVSKGTHTQTLAELEEARKAAAQTVAAFEAFKKRSAAEADGLKKQLEALRQELGSSQNAVNDANVRIAALEKEKEQAAAALGVARNQARDLETKLEGEQARAAGLEEEKQRLMSGTTRAQEEIARLQKRVSELETVVARAADLDKRLQEREQELGALKQELSRLQQQEQRLKTEEAEKARLEQERTAKEAEVQRLTTALEAEIANGNARLQQVRDRLTINLLDRVLFNSGQGELTPEGRKVLKQVSEVLKTVTDKQIRVEGHTDNVLIGPKLRERFRTNWELSTARAISVVRYLIEAGGVDRATLTAMGYADTKPVAGNDTKERRAANRRIEIVLSPKDLSEIASQLKP